jgi:hypothetical protein
MKFDSTDLRKFDPEQQDLLLAEMQRDSLNLVQNAAALADRESAKVAFAAITNARARLVNKIEIVQSRRADEEESQPICNVIGAFNDVLAKHRPR